MDTVIIFQKPGLYFFPHYQGLVFPPYDRPEGTPLYYLYRAMNLLKLPSAWFWGSWKEQVKHARHVVIMDYGYQRGMEAYIRRVNPDCRVVLYCWNKFDKAHHNHLLYSDKDSIYSTDPGDCSRYHVRPAMSFYPTEWAQPWQPGTADRLFFLGTDKGRAPMLLALKQRLAECGVQADIRVLSSSQDAEYRRRHASLLIDKPLGYSEYLEQVRRTGILLEMPQAGQLGLTLRAVESVVFSKKLITTNPDIRRYSFYHPENILITEHPEALTADELRAFVQAPFVPYTAQDVDQFSFNTWLTHFDDASVQAP